MTRYGTEATRNACPRAVAGDNAELNRAAQMASCKTRNTEYNGEHTVRHFCAETAQRSHGQEAVDVAARETDKRTEAAGEVCKHRQTDSAEHNIDEHGEAVPRLQPSA